MKYFNKFGVGLNVLLGLSLIYFFIMLCGKYFLLDQNYSVSSRLFQWTGCTKGQLISSLENRDFEQADRLAGSNEEYQGIMAWARGDYSKAAELFQGSCIP